MTAIIVRIPLVCVYFLCGVSFDVSENIRGLGGC